MAISERANDDRLPPRRRPGDENSVTNLHNSVWPRGLAVHINLSPLARPLSFGASAEQTRDIEPDIEAHEVSIMAPPKSRDALVTNEEREDVLQLLANYENMARAVESLIHRLKLDAEFNSGSPRYREQLRDLTELVPVWREYAANVRVKFMLERRSTLRGDTPSADVVPEPPAD